jgi:hypothetical protein
MLLQMGCMEKESTPFHQTSAQNDTLQNPISSSTTRSLKSINALVIHRDHPLLEEDALKWQKMLQPYGINVTLKTKKRLKTSSFSGIDLIITGTGRIEKVQYTYETIGNRRIYKSIEPDPQLKWDLWKERKLAELISQSKLPIIGIGPNGCSLFFAMGLPTNSMHHKYDESDPNLTFVFTKDSRKYTEGPFKIHEDRVSFVNINDSVSSYIYPPLFMKGILEEVGKPGIYPLVRFHKYVSWCCGRDPNSFSETTKRLFANIAYILVEESRENKEKEKISELQEQNYNNALEYYNNYCVKKLDPEEVREKLYSMESNPGDYLHLYRLQHFRQDWSVEKPDTDVPEEYLNEINEIVSQLYPDESFRKSWDSITFSFYGGNRCLVNITRYDHGGFPFWGIQIHLIKYDGKWESLSKHTWIS